MTAIAPNCPMSVQLCEIAVRTISAANSNSRPGRIQQTDNRLDGASRGSGLLEEWRLDRTPGQRDGGSVINVQRAKKNGQPAVLDVQFTFLTLPNGRQRAINGSLTDLETSTGTSDNEGTVTAHKTTHRKPNSLAAALRVVVRGSPSVPESER